NSFGYGLGTVTSSQACRSASYLGCHLLLQQPPLALTGLSTLADTGELADVLAVTEHIDWAAAHVLTVARHLDWEIVTHDQARWAAIRDVLPWPLELVVLSDE
ncbi:hypothetical protein AB0L82_43460, partial [Nocardia sp. NPDC052001]|uniref:hypothetical protein n=1 Tax=Nocardia sp. NPDC052001 TaxID=3154853 RepID=UPI0034467E0C